MATTPAKKMVVELWLTDYVKDAYTDQTGKSHFGEIVYEQTIATEVSRYDVKCHYTGDIAKDAGVVASDAAGREFRSEPPTDFGAGRYWRGPKPETHKGFWKAPPTYPKGYCYPDGSGPVRHLIPKS